jgi:peptide/nickel transport system substrate-binding protein
MKLQRAGVLVPVFMSLALLVFAGAPSKAAEKANFVVDIVNEPSSLDPQVQWNPDSYYVYRNIFDNLVTRSDSGEFAPEVASSWKTLSDTQIEFTIRDDIRFHDGAPLTPADVVFSVRRITDPAFASPQLGQFNKIVKAEETGPHTVTLTTDGPYPALLAQLVKLSVVPKHVVEAVGDEAFNLNPIGSGPYRFDAWQRGVSVTLARNEAYWGRKGPFGTVVFRIVPDAATRVADLQAGAADLVTALNSDIAAQLETSSNAKRLSALTERLAYLRLNPYKAPFDNRDVRRAAAYAIDKQGIVEGILGGDGRVLGQMLTPAHFGWSDDVAGLPYDPAQARALLGKAGAGAKAEIALATAPFFDQRVVQAVQQMMNDVGFNVSINLMDTGSFLKLIQQGAADGPVFAASRSSCACQDADGALIQLFHSGNNWTIMSDPRLDEWLDAARATLDPDKRKDLYRKVGELIAEEVPVIPLFQTVQIFGAAKPLQWTPTANESLFLNRMAWVE